MRQCKVSIGTTDACPVGRHNVLGYFRDVLQLSELETLGILCHAVLFIAFILCLFQREKITRVIFMNMLSLFIFLQVLHDIC